VIGPPDFLRMGPPDFLGMDPPNFLGMGPPAGAAFRARQPAIPHAAAAPGAERRCQPRRKIFRGNPHPTPAPDRGADALCGARHSVHTPSRGLRSAHRAIRYRRAFFSRGRWMARRQLTVQRHEEIKRRLAEGRSVREIASALKCSRRLVREIRDGQRDTHKTAPAPDPLWMSQLEWPAILHDHGLGFPLKFLWDERAKTLTTYSNFWKQFYRKFPQCRKDGVTARTFEPGERVEVDYAATQSSGTTSRPARSTRPTCSSPGSASVSCCSRGLRRT